MIRAAIGPYPISDMSIEREKPAAAVIDGKLYVTGGWRLRTPPVRALEIYDPVLDTWTPGAQIPKAYGASTGVNLNGKFYVIGGCDDDCLRLLRAVRYTIPQPTPGPLRRTTGADFVDRLRSDRRPALLRGSVRSANGASLHTYVYDPGLDAWSPLADMPKSFWGMSYVASGQSLYLSGGVSDGNTLTNEGIAYDVTGDSWSPDCQFESCSFPRRQRVRILQNRRWRPESCLRPTLKSIRASRIAAIQSIFPGSVRRRTPAPWPRIPGSNPWMSLSMPRS